ncbi:MAG: hypothetical protein KY467_13930 [Gemmatimonadetes bacterium]|nr:hypothetical protein [Gemmatimonadota bacterium]
MNARRILTAAAIAIATATGAACAGDGPTLSSNPVDDGTAPLVPDAPPTDTTGFIPPSMVP